MIHRTPRLRTILRPAIIHALCALFCIRTGLNGHSHEGRAALSFLFFFVCNHLGFPLIQLSPRDGHQRVHVVRCERRVLGRVLHPAINRVKDLC